MATIIKKIRLINFKRFKDYVIEPNVTMIISSARLRKNLMKGGRKM